MSIRPRNDLVLVEEESEHGWHTEETPSGILLQVNQANPICSGRVKALGPKVSPSMGLEIGTKVHYRAENGGHEVGEKLWLIKAGLLDLAGEGLVTGR